MNRYDKNKWITLISFSLMYNMVYIGRFNISSFIGEIAGEIYMSGMQQNLITGGVFISYAAGSFVNGYLADRFGAKKIIVTGGIMSCLLNITVAFQGKWAVLLCICLANGYFQSMIWAGGMSLIAEWWERKERGKGVGTANFFSGMSHTMAYILPAIIFSVNPFAGWRINFIIPMIAMLLFVVIFAILAADRPEEKGLEPYETNIDEKKHETRLAEIHAAGCFPWKLFLGNRKFMIWCGIAMISSVCRYGLLNRIPLYYEQLQEGMIISEAFLSLTLPVGMAFGTFVITWFTGARFADNKGIMICALSAMCGTLIIVFPMLESTEAILIGIFFTGFVLYGINGILWIYAIDYGKRFFSGSAAGILNGFAYLGAGAEGLIFSLLIDFTGSNFTVFIFMEALCIGMAVLGILVTKKDTVIIPEVGIKD